LDLLQHFLVNPEGQLEVKHLLRFVNCLRERVVLMARLCPSNHDISFLSGNFVPVISS
jgi:hypothetical protein